jgi:hypothetical protein
MSFDHGDSNAVTIQEWHRRHPEAGDRAKPWWLACDQTETAAERPPEKRQMMFGQLSNGGVNSEPVSWHALRPQGEGWRTVCTAMSARPGMRVIATSPEPGPAMCKLKRCQRVMEEWKSQVSAAGADSQRAGSGVRK